MIISGIWVICNELIRLKFDKFDGLSRFSCNLRLWTDIWTLINWKQKAGVAIDFCAWYPEFLTGQIETVLQLSHSSTSRVAARRFSQHTISGKSSANVKLNWSSREYHKNRPTPPQASRSFTINRNEYIHDCVSSTELATTTRFSLAEFFSLPWLHGFQSMDILRQTLILLNQLCNRAHGGHMVHIIGRPAWAECPILISFDFLYFFLSSTFVRFFQLIPALWQLHFYLTRNFQRSSAFFEYLHYEKVTRYRKFL